MQHRNVLLLFLLLLPFSLPASEETDQLRQQIKMLEARLETIEKREHQAVVTPASAENKNPVTVNYKPGKGLQFTSADKQYQVRMGGYFQADNRTFVNQSNPSTNTNQFFIRSARPVIEARLDKFSTRFMLDFGNGQSTLVDAYGDYNASRPLTCAWENSSCRWGLSAG